MIIITSDGQRIWLPQIAAAGTSVAMQTMLIWQ